MRKDSQICENQPPEPLPSENSDSPQTIQTYKDFTDSLSEVEREKFETFCRTLTASYSKPIVSMLDYLAAPDASGKPRYIDFWERFSHTSVAVEREQQLTSALTEDLYQTWEAEFRQMDCDSWAFASLSQRDTPEWELRLKFLDEFNRRNKDGMPLL